MADNPVLSVEDACTYLNITDQDDRVAASMPGIIAAAVAALEQRVGPLIARSVTETIGGCRGALLVTTPPLSSLTSLTGCSGTSIDVSTLSITNWGAICYLDGFSRFGEMAYTATYQAGWSSDAGSIPADLLIAVKELVRHLWMPFRGAPGRTPAATAPESNLTSFELPNRVLQLTAPYEWARIG